MVADVLCKWRNRWIIQGVSRWTLASQVALVLFWLCYNVCKLILKIVFTIYFSWFCYFSLCFPKSGMFGSFVHLPDVPQMLTYSHICIYFHLLYTTTVDLKWQPFYAEHCHFHGVRGFWTGLSWWPGAAWFLESDKMSGVEFRCSIGIWQLKNKHEAQCIKIWRPRRYCCRISTNLLHS